MIPARWLLVSLMCIALSGMCMGQADTATVRRDTSEIVQPLLRDSLRSLSPASIPMYVPAKKPWVAVGLSAAMPGAGQIYNHSYWKLPIIWGFGGYWVSEWIKENNLYKEYRDKYSLSVAQGQPNGGYLNQRDFYRDARDSFAWYLGALYFLNLIDAYVGASLYDFDVSPDLGIRGDVSPGVRASVRVGF